MRYQVIEGSGSGHCCFEATVVDTSKMNTACECFRMEDAQLICDALNAKDALELPELEDEGEVCWDKKDSFMSYPTPLVNLKLPKL
jgi:hypothetical protein